jgi:hypothetical protein
MKKIIKVLIWNCMLVLPVLVQAQTIVTLNGVPTFDTSVLSITEAGLDFSANISEIQANTTISVQNNSVKNNNYIFLLRVNLVETPQGMDVTLVRTGNGTNQGGGSAGGNISGGTTVITLSTIPADFFTGKGDRLNVPIRFGLRNLSVVQPAGNVPVNLIFTVIEI